MLSTAMTDGTQKLTHHDWDQPQMNTGDPVEGVNLCHIEKD